MFLTRYFAQGRIASQSATNQGVSVNGDVINSVIITGATGPDILAELHEKAEELLHFQNEPTITQLTRRVSACRDLSTFSDLMQQCTDILGCERWALQVRLNTNNVLPPIIFGSFPRAWVTHYFANNYFDIDPVGNHYSADSFPRQWAYLMRYENMTPLQKQFAADAYDVGLGDGISVPIYTNIFKGALSFSCNARPDKIEKILEHFGPSLIGFALHSGAKITAFHSGTDCAVPSPRSSLGAQQHCQANT
jgi:hypothetical protein